ncbi:MAG: nitrous oxide reductase accessory protein NosL, partial [Ginsengibacter sp.]
ANNRKLFFFTAFLFICFGIIAMIDFWRWEYNYGHNLDPNAAIIVPGMAYQPPLIGFKQLLNFGAYSQPDIGGWIFALTGVILLGLAIMEFISLKKRSQSLKPAIAIAISFLFFIVTSCNSGPEPIVVGKDHCDFCKMAVSDDRFGAEIVTKKGKIFKFDDAHCVFSFLENNGLDKSAVKDFYFTDFSGDHSLIKANNAFFLKSDQLRSPMAGNIAAFSNKDSFDKVKAEFSGNIVSWGELHH